MSGGTPRPCKPGSISRSRSEHGAGERMSSSAPMPSSRCGIDIQQASPHRGKQPSLLRRMAIVVFDIVL